MLNNRNVNNEKYSCIFISFYAKNETSFLVLEIRYLNNHGTLKKIVGSLLTCIRLSNFFCSDQIIFSPVMNSFC